MLHSIGSSKYMCRIRAVSIYLLGSSKIHESPPNNTHTAPISMASTQLTMPVSLTVPYISLATLRVHMLG